MSTAHQLETDFLVAWRRFRRLLEACQQALQADTGRPLWLYEHSDDNARSALVEIVGQIFFEDEQPPRETITLPGIVGSSEASLECARKLNAAKDHVRDALQALDGQSVSRNNPATGRSRKQRLSDLVLATHGLARLHRVQTYRHLRCIDKAPDKVGMTWAHTRRVHRVTPAEMIKELERMHKRGGEQAPLIEQDMLRLSELKPGQALAQVDEQPEHARANLAWRTPEGEWERRQITLSLPLLYPAPLGNPLPALKELRDPQSLPRRERKEGRLLDDTPLLRTLPVYRYIMTKTKTKKTKTTTVEIYD